MGQLNYIWMVGTVAYLVFLVPVVISVPVAAYVMYDILQKPDRELDMWPEMFTNSNHTGGHAKTTLHDIHGSGMELKSNTERVIN